MGVYRKMSLVPVQRPEWLAYSEPIKFDFSNLTEGQAVYIYGWRTLETNLYGTKICYLITDEMPVITNDNKLRAQNYKQEEFMQGAATSWIENAVRATGDWETLRQRRFVVEARFEKVTDKRCIVLTATT